jgi:MFS family permease
MIAAIAGFIAREKLLAIGSFVFPVLLLVYAGVRWLPLSLAILVGVGWAFMVVVNSSNSLVQTQVPDALRGRVMGIFTFTFFGLMPIGSLLAGAAAARIGEPLTVVIGGAILLALAVWIRLRIPELRAS